MTLTKKTLGLVVSMISMSDIVLLQVGHNFLLRIILVAHLTQNPPCPHSISTAFAPSLHISHPNAFNVSMYGFNPSMESSRTLGSVACFTFTFRGACFSLPNLV